MLLLFAWTTICARSLAWFEEAPPKVRAEQHLPGQLDQGPYSDAYCFVRVAGRRAGAQIIGS